MTRILTLCCMVLIAGCLKTVSLTVRNPTDAPHEVSVTVISKAGMRDPNPLQMGRVAPDQSLNRRFDVDNGGGFEVRSRLRNSAHVFKRHLSVTSRDPNPYPVTIDLEIQGQWVDESLQLSTIQGAFSDMGPNLGFRPIPVKNALETVFGALMIVLPPEKEKPAKKLFTLTPAQFGTPVKLSDFEYPDNGNTFKSYITQTIEAKVSATPLFGKLGLTMETGSAYEVEWSMSRYGMILKPEPADWSYLQGFSKLSLDVRMKILKLLADNPSAKLLYVNEMYVLNRASFRTKRGHKVSAGAEIGAASIVTASGTYDFSKSQLRKKEFNTTVLNAVGIEMTPARVERNPDGQHSFNAVSLPALTQEDYKSLILMPGSRRYGVPAEGAE